MDASSSDFAFSSSFCSVSNRRSYNSTSAPWPLASSNAAFAFSGETGIAFSLFGLPELFPPDSPLHERGHTPEHEYPETHSSDSHGPKEKSGAGKTAPPSGYTAGPAHPDQTPRFFQQLNSSDPSEREEAIDALADRNDPAILDALARALENEKDDGLSLKLALALTPYRRENALRAMLDLLNHSGIPFVREEALRYLQSLSEESFGYDALKPPAENAEAIQRWKAWWEENGSKSNQAR